VRCTPLLAGVGAAVAVLGAVSPAPAAPAVGADPLPLAGRVVAIDPGHQLGNSQFPAKINRQVWVGLWKPCNTTGTATNGGFPEATFAWRVSTRLRARLEALGARVRMTRTTNSRDEWGPCIDVRGRFGARVGADVAVSVHGDGAGPATRGFFVVRPGMREGYTDDIAGRSRWLARRVRAGLLGAGFRASSAYGGDGLDTRRDLGTLNTADVPTVLVELGNMRNAADARCMTSPDCRDRYARGLADGVRSYLTRAAPRPATAVFHDREGNPARNRLESPHDHGAGWVRTDARVRARRKGADATGEGGDQRGRDQAGQGRADQGHAVQGHADQGHGDQGHAEQRRAGQGRDRRPAPDA
jgi:N-acetylmuramoyl-L-alanine amidase